MNVNFEAHKLIRELKKSGTDFTFKRKSLNEFGEDDGTEMIVGSIIGLYHEVNSYVSIATSDGSRTRTEKQPMVLCLYRDLKAMPNGGVNVGDYVDLSDGKRFTVNGIVDIQKWNIIADISLEVVDNGRDVVAT